LTTWKGGRVLKRDVGTAKNYLGAKEIDTFNRIMVMFLDQHRVPRPTAAGYPHAGLGGVSRQVPA
jgi:hypothetical protein